MGSIAMDLPAERDAEVTAQMIAMVRMILLGAQEMGTNAAARSRDSVLPRRRNRQAAAGG
jgi:hypothetical protein